MYVSKQSKNLADAQVQNDPAQLSDDGGYAASG